MDVFKKNVNIKYSPTLCCVDKIFTYGKSHLHSEKFYNLLEQLGLGGTLELVFKSQITLM